MTLGLVLKEIRKKNKLTQEELGKLVKLSSREIRRYENCEIKNPRIDVVFRIAYHLGTQLVIVPKDLKK